MSLARTKAKEVIEEFGIDSPDILEHLEELCWALGVVVRMEHVSGSDARLTMRNGQGVITVSSEEIYGSKARYSIGHELGHFLLHRDVQSALFCNAHAMRCWFGKQNAIIREVEANEFSSELLMPEKLVEPIVRSGNPNFAILEKITEAFQSSLTASAIRLVDLTDEAVAVVAYSKDRVKWFKRSKLFEEQKYWIEQGKLDSCTLAYDAIKGKNPKHMESVDVTAWFSLKDWQAEKYQDETIKEQTRYFPQIDFGLSVLWIDSSNLIWI